MIGFTELQFIWWMIVGGIVVLYATTAGFDFGTTMIMPFMRKEGERRVALNIIGRTWDGNQTWLVFLGGALFVVWPVAYAVTFSGMYAAILCILWSFFLRPPGFDYRSKIDSHAWRRFWDLGLFISSFIPVLIFGVALGNFLQGIPFYFDPITLRSFYQGNFFDLLNPFGVLCGLTALVMCVMHGAALLHRRTEEDLKRFFKKIFCVFAVLFLILMTVGGFMVAYYVKGYTLVQSPLNPTLHPLSNVVTSHVGAWLTSYAQYPWKVVGPLFAYMGVIGALLTLSVGRGGLAFWCSVVAVAGAVMTAGMALFPFIVPSSIKPAQSMTVWNASSTPYTLNVMLYVISALLLFTLVIKVFLYFSVWRDKQTMTVADVDKNKHTFY